MMSFISYVLLLVVSIALLRSAYHLHQAEKALEKIGDEAQQRRSDYAGPSFDVDIWRQAMARDEASRAPTKPASKKGKR